MHTKKMECMSPEIFIKYSKVFFICKIQNLSDTCHLLSLIRYCAVFNNVHITSK